MSSNKPKPWTATYKYVYANSEDVEFNKRWPKKDRIPNFKVGSVMGRELVELSFLASDHSHWVGDCYEISEPDLKMVLMAPVLLYHVGRLAELAGPLLTSGYMDELIQDLIQAGVVFHPSTETPAHIRPAETRRPGKRPRGASET
jgi:hypothetical protein